MIRVLAASVLLLSASSASAAPSPAAGTDEYVREAKSRVLYHAPTGSRPEVLSAERYDFGNMVAVCGKVRLGGGETLPFIVSWKRHQGINDALVMAPLAETPAAKAMKGQRIAMIEQICEGARREDGKVDPPSPSPPNITPAQYIEAARAKVRRDIEGLADAQIASIQHATAKTGDIYVCGVVSIGAQRIPFAATWEADEPLDESGFVMGVARGSRRGETPAENPTLEVFSNFVRDTCKRIGLEDVVR